MIIPLDDHVRVKKGANMGGDNVVYGPNYRINDLESLFNGQEDSVYNENGDLVAEHVEGEPVRFSVRTWEDGGRGALAQYL